MQLEEEVKGEEGGKVVNKMKIYQEILDGQSFEGYWNYEMLSKIKECLLTTPNEEAFFQYL